MIVDICLPVFNEEEIIGPNVNRLFDYCHKSSFGFDWQIVIINNGSTDRTKEIALKLLSDRIKYFEIKVPGRGRALREYWLRSESDVLAYMDIDMAVSLDHVADLLAPLVSGEADLVIGSRNLPKSKCQRSFFRDSASKVYIFLLHHLLHCAFSDLQCGFKAVKNDMFKKLSPYLRNDYWFFDTELVVFCSAFHGRIQELAVDWQENRYEKRKSKVAVLRDGVSSLASILALRSRIKKLNKETGR